MPDATPTQAQVDQAIDWLVKLRFDSPCPRTRQQFEQWLASHPHHPLAWQRVSLLSDELAGLPKDLSRRTLEGSQQQRSSRRNHLKLLALLAVGGSLAWRRVNHWVYLSCWPTTAPPSASVARCRGATAAVSS